MKPYIQIYLFGSAISFLLMLVYYPIYYSFLENKPIYATKRKKWILLITTSLVSAALSWLGFLMIIFDIQNRADDIDNIIDQHKSNKEDHLNLK